MMIDDPILPVIRAGVAVSPLPVVTAALIGAGLPAESAAKFADVAVEVVRSWLWGTAGRNDECVCDPTYSERGLEDPRCPAHDYDRMLGGDGHGIRMTAAMQRERVAVTAAKLRDQLGEDIYAETLAPVFAKRLEEINATESDDMETAVRG